MSRQSVKVEGFILGSETGDGLAELSIEAWTPLEAEFKPLAEGRSNAQGLFALELPLVPELDLENDTVRIEFRLLDQDNLILAEVRELPVVGQGPQPIQFFIPNMMPHSSGGGARSDNLGRRHEVHGRVWGLIPSGTKIQGVLYSLARDGGAGEIHQSTIGEAPVENDGAFNLKYAPLSLDASAAINRLELHLMGPEDDLLVMSAPVDPTRESARVDITMPGSKSGPCEYELLEERLQTEIEAVPSVLDGMSADALYTMADEIDVEPERLGLLQRARDLAAETGLPAPLFYALGSMGVSLELVDLIDVPLSELRETITAAIDNEIISESMVEDVGTLLAQLSENTLDCVLETDQPSMGGGLGEIMACADLPREVVRRVLGRYQARTAGVAEFWESLRSGDGEQEAVDQNITSALELAVNLSGLLGADPALVGTMMTLRKEGRWEKLEDLADLDFDDWCEILESLEEPDSAQITAIDATPVSDTHEWAGEGAEADAEVQLQEDDDGDHVAGKVQGLEEWGADNASAFDGEADLFSENDTPVMYDDMDAPQGAYEDLDDAEEEEQDWVEVRAEAILDTMEEALPSKFILKELHLTEVLSDGARRLLERAPGHDLLAESIRERVSQDAGFLEGYAPNEAEAVIEEVEAIERVSRVTHHAQEVAVLVGTGMDSAHAIAAQPRRHFVDVYGEALGGRAQASRVHAQAQQTAGASTLAIVNLLQALQQTPLVLGGGLSHAQSTRDRALKDIPDARTLFGSIGLCDCKHCRSVYSPAAYLVDLLRYLDIRDPERLEKFKKILRKRRHSVRVIRSLSRYKPLDVLLARRPDLADVPLTCENTKTPLPYIDLVNELLEARVTGRSAAHDTGSTPADVLKAVPQFVDRDAYERLRQAVYPAMLPFHEPLAVSRAYLGHLGVKRRDLLQTLTREKNRDNALLAESLGMSPEAFAIVSQPLDKPWRYFGFESEQVGGMRYTEALAHAPPFMRRTGIRFKELIDLVSMRFVNAKDEIKLESPSPDCDPEKVRITGLNENRLSRMVRVLRLRKYIGFSLVDLDRALFAMGAEELDPPVLKKLVEARDLSKQLDKPISQMLGLWAPLDTYGKDNQFERLLRTRAVAWRIKDTDTFKLQANRRELAHTADRLDAVAPALLAAFRMTNEELAMARTIHARLSGKLPRLDLAGLSAIYRVAFLARALKIRIDQLDGLLRLVPPNANPFRPADPAATRRFLEIVQEVKGSDFSPEKLVYLFNPAKTLRPNPGPNKAQVQTVLTAIRSGLTEAISATERPAALTGDVLRQKLGIYLDAALVNPAMEVLDPRTKLGREKRHQFFKRHLDRIFPDAEQAAQQLFNASLPPTPPGTGTATAKSREGAAAADRQKATATQAAGRTDSAGEQRWRSNIEMVITHLLPVLRARQMRGAVVQVLSDTLGTSSISTGRLIDSLMRSRRSAGRPLIEDFYALLGTGLTGHYFSNGDLKGEPTVTRTDSKLEFAWAGAAPVAGVAGSGFSVRWAGRLLPRSKAPHTFFVSTDGGVRLSIKIDGADQILLEESGGTGSITEYVSKAVPLDPAKLYDIIIEYRNKSAAASFSVQFGTSPDSKQPIPTTHFFPMDGLPGFDAVAMSYRRLHKAALFLTGFGVSDDQLQWLSGEPRYVDFDKLPMQPTDSKEAIALFQRWRQLAALYALRKKLAKSDTDLFATFSAGTLAASIDLLTKATGWNKSVVEGFVGEKGFAVNRQGLTLPVAPDQTPLLLRISKAVAIQRRVGVSPDILFSWANSVPDADVAAAIIQAVKARYDEKRWLEVAQGLNDPLRVERRDALVAYLLPRLREQGVKNRNQLFEYFLIDVEMNPCMLTSRIKQAISAVQTFFQRCLMNLEAQVPPRLIDAGDWKWLKNYRVWEANRKVFLYPENWIEPELRDDKTPEFKALEQTILQQEIKKENVESAFIDYLQRLDEVSRLDVRAVWFERRARKGRPRPGDRKRIDLKRGPPPGAVWEEGTYHIFARTYNAPHVWFYRQLEKGRVWTPWEKIDADIEGDHLVPVMFQNRMHLLWTVFREKNKPSIALEKDAAPFKLGKDWEIGLAYSVYDRGRWTRKKLSSLNVVDRLKLFFPLAQRKKKKKKQAPRIEGSAWLPQSAYTLQAVPQNSQGRLTVYLYRRAIDWLQVMRSHSPKSGDDILSRNDVESISHFELVGCNGELAPVSLGQSTEVKVGRPTTRRSRESGFISTGIERRPTRTRRTRLPVPAGYKVDATGYAPSPGKGALLRLPAQASGGLATVLGRTRGRARGVRILPVVDPSARRVPGLSPFFFQDPQRTYFVRPVAIWIGSKMIRVPVAMPLTGARYLRIVPRFGRRRGVRHRSRRGRRREALALVQQEMALDTELGLETPALTPERNLGFEAVDDWEDAEDAAWHPEDAQERRGRRRRRRRSKARRKRKRLPPPSRQKRTHRAVKARSRRPVRLQFRQVRQAPHWEQRLRFLPFEHAQTCRFINVLKSDGIEKLLALGTTRSRYGHQDHRMLNDRWVPKRPTQFEKRYRPGGLTDRQFPRLDVEFDHDNPYAQYNWELFFHAPLQVAVRLAKDGRHEEAQRWFHFIFDPTTDATSPAPKRYWRFWPFHENTDYDGAKRLMALLSYAGKEERLILQQKRVLDQVSAWWETPFSPHVIARLRIAAYQKAVVMKYIDNLIEWGDKLFRRDTMESIQEATQLYILAGNILGPRPERVPAMVETQPVTFRQVREKIDPFANWVVRFENSQVRRPFRVNARPDIGAATSVLGMATQYFCVPANPEMEKKWDTVEDRLFKIRNCMNIKGVVRQLALFEPPIDPAMLVKAAAAGVDLGSVVASLNAPPPIQRFRFLIQRAIEMAKELRRFGKAMLTALERRDAEALATLHQSNAVVMEEAIRDVQKTRIKQVEEELAWQALQVEYINADILYVQALAQELMNAQEVAKQESLTSAQVIAGVAEGIDLVTKVLHAIPEFQAGAAGGFSSPFTTVQLGGQMFGDISAAVAESMFKVMNKFQTEAEMAAAQAEYQRRQAEFAHQEELLLKKRDQIQKQIEEIKLKLEISNAELKRHDTAVENARKVSAHFRDKFTNQELYGWMLGQLSAAYFQAYKFAFDTAKIAERGLQFERGDTSMNYVEFSYWDSLKKGLLAGERLLLDIQRMESAYLEGDHRALEVKRHVSLEADAPTALEELLATGRCRVDVSEALLDGDFPGHYFRRVKTVSMSMTGPIKAHANINCTLTLLRNRIRTSANASGSYPQSQDGDDSRFLMNLVPVQAIATSLPNSDPGMFQLNFDDDRYLPFEGAGAISSWRIELHQSNNMVNLSELSDVVLSIAYTARNGGKPLGDIARANWEKGLAQGGQEPLPQYRIALRNDLPAVWKQLHAAKEGQKLELKLPLSRSRLPARFLGFDLSIERVTVYARSRKATAADALNLQITPPDGAAAQVMGWTRPWASSQTLRAKADIKGSPGSWTLSVSTKGAKVSDLLDDIVFIFDLQAKKAQG